MEPVSAVSVVLSGDIWEVNEGLDNNGLLRVFVASMGKNWFVMYWLYKKKSMDMEHGIRESVYQIAEIEAGYLFYVNKWRENQHWKCYLGREKLLSLHTCSYLSAR